ncbi:MAG TPA: hypothetical protein VKU02_17260 [Gemmataceae bacterium]|nr:hypothetical protein [Gemmataceae bacterium]
MKKRIVCPMIAGIAAIALFATGSVAQAGQGGTDTISIHFGADEPTQVAGSMLAATDVTGVVPSGNWNNETTNAGTDSNLLEDVNGTASRTGAQVVWYASNTWASTGKGEENNNFQGADHTLMSGYLDMEVGQPAVTFIQVSNLPASFSGTFDVYIYALAGVPGRGGIYEVNGAQNRGVGPQGNYAYYVASGTADPTKTGTQGLYSGPDWVQAIGDDKNFGSDGVNQDDFGNYIAFYGLQGPTVNITAVSLAMPSLPGYNGTPRAPLNGIQLVVD